MPEQLSQPERNFIERLGLIAESGGLTRITGRIWGLLIVSGKALASAEIAEALQISRGSVSMNIKQLESFDLLDARTRAGDRQTYYAMRAHPYMSMIQAQAKRTAEYTAVVRNALEEITCPEARKRLEDLAAFYEITGQGYGFMLERLEALKQRQTARKTAGREAGRKPGTTARERGK